MSKTKPKTTAHPKPKDTPGKPKPTTPISDPKPQIA
jgi:hypothetical protein